MDSLIITCKPDNVPSRKNCEKVGLKLIEIVDLPPHNELYGNGGIQMCRYEWILK